MFCAYRWIERKLGRDIANIIGAYCLPEVEVNRKRYYIYELKYIQELRENYDTFYMCGINNHKFNGIIAIYINLKNPDWDLNIPYTGDNTLSIPRMFINKYIIELLKSRKHNNLLSYKLRQNGRTKIIQLPSLIK